MMKKNRKSIAYGLPCVKTEFFIAIMRATECQDFVIEVTNIERKSNFFRTIILDEKYQKRQKKITDEYLDIRFQTTLNRELQKTISNIIESEPEIISVYCNLLSEIEDISLETNWDVILEFLLDENVFILSCVYELYANLQLQISRVLRGLENERVWQQ